MNADIDISSVEDLDRALRLYRRLLLRLVIIFFGGIAVGIVLARLGTLLSPPYGIYILGEGLGTWALIAMLALIVAEVWVDGRAIGKALNDPVMRTMPFLGLLSGLSVIAGRAQAMEMEWSGFLGPLRPKRR